MINRRKALKNIGLSIGSLMATPMAMSLLQSCQKETTPWNPVFFSPDESIVIKNIVDLILPHTDDLPGAIDLNIHVFLDRFMAEIYTDEVKAETKEGMAAIMNTFNLSEEKSVASLKEKDYDALLNKYLSVTQKEKKKLEEEETEKVILDTLYGIRDLTIWAYKNTEEIGENVLAYDPIPGVQIGCAPLEELTGGKAYTL